MVSHDFTFYSSNDGSVDGRDTFSNSTPHSNPSTQNITPPPQTHSTDPLTLDSFQTYMTERIVKLAESKYIPQLPNNLIADNYYNLASQALHDAVIYNQLVNRNSVVKTCPPFVTNIYDNISKPTYLITPSDHMAIPSVTTTSIISNTNNINNNIININHINNNINNINNNVNRFSSNIYSTTAGPATIVKSNVTSGNKNKTSNDNSKESSNSHSNIPPAILERIAHGERYKTELCRPFTEQGKCRYGTKCQYAHGSEELRNISRHPKYKTDKCKTFHSNGFCPYGARCNFVHDETEDVLVELRRIHEEKQKLKKNHSLDEMNSEADLLSNFEKLTLKSSEGGLIIRGSSSSPPTSSSSPPISSSSSSSSAAAATTTTMLKPTSVTSSSSSRLVPLLSLPSPTTTSPPSHQSATSPPSPSSPSSLFISPNTMSFSPILIAPPPASTMASPFQALSFFLSSPASLFSSSSSSPFITPPTSPKMRRQPQPPNQRLSYSPTYSAPSPPLSPPLSAPQLAFPQSRISPSQCSPFFLPPFITQSSSSPSLTSLTRSWKTNGYEANSAINSNKLPVSKSLVRNNVNSYNKEVSREYKITNSNYMNNVKNFKTGNKNNVNENMNNNIHMKSSCLNNSLYNITDTTHRSRSSSTCSLEYNNKHNSGQTFRAIAHIS